MNCRGEENREIIFKENKIVPIMCIRLVDGQSKISCTGKEITKTCYYFSYKNKKDPSKKGGIICGSLAANHFFDLLKTRPLEVFNPLKSDPDEITGFSSHETDIDRRNIDKIEWHPLSKELSNAINMLFICWKLGRLKEPLLGIMKDLNKYPSSKPYLNKIKTMNRVVEKDFKNRTLIEMIEELRMNKPNMKSFSFPLINAELKKNGIKSFIG